MPASGIYTVAKTGLLTGTFNFGSDSLKMALVNGYTPDFVNHTTYSSLTNEVTGTGYTAGGQALAGVTVTTTQANSWGVSRATGTAYKVGQHVRPSTGNGFVYRCVVAGTTGNDTAVTGATNASPIVITTGTAHGLATGDTVTISGVLGNTAANGTWQVTVLTSTTYSLNGSTGNAAYTSGGTVTVAFPTTPGTAVSDGTATFLCVGTTLVTVTATSPSWANATITATGSAIYDVTAANKLVTYLDFGGTVASTAGTFSVTLDGTNGFFNDAA